MTLSDFLSMIWRKAPNSTGFIFLLFGRGVKSENISGIPVIVLRASSPVLQFCGINLQFTRDFQTCILHVRAKFEYKQISEKRFVTVFWQLIRAHLELF